MKKKSLIGFVTLLMSLGLTACPGSTPPDTGNDGWVATKDGHYLIENGKKGPLEKHTLVDYPGDKTHVVVEATCDMPGKGYDQCEVCKKVIDKTIPALGHNLVDNGGSSEATCDNPAYVDKTCSRCGYVEKKTTGEPLGHQWGAAETIKDGITKATCGRSGCGSVSFTFDTAKTDSGWNGATGTGNTAYKMGSRSKEENGTWNFTAGSIPDGKYAIEIECQMTNSSHEGRYFFNHVQNNVDDPASNDSDKDGASEAPFRYQFALNGSTEYVNPDNKKTYGENNLSSSEYNYVRLVSSCNVTNLTSLTLHHGLIGYSLLIKNVRLVKLNQAA